MGYKRVKRICVSKKDAEGKSIKTADGKGIWIDCGAIIKDDEGNMKICLDVIPISALGHGALYLNCFDPMPYNTKKKAKPEPKSSEEFEDTPF